MNAVLAYCVEGLRPFDLRWNKTHTSHRKYCMCPRCSLFGMTRLFTRDLKANKRQWSVEHSKREGQLPRRTNTDGFDERNRSCWTSRPSDDRTNIHHCCSEWWLDWSFENSRKSKGIWTLLTGRDDRWTLPDSRKHSIATTEPTDRLLDDRLIATRLNMSRFEWSIDVQNLNSTRSSPPVLSHWTSDLFFLERCWSCAVDHNRWTCTKIFSSNNNRHRIETSADRDDSDTSKSNWWRTSMTSNNHHRHPSSKWQWRVRWHCLFVGWSEDILLSFDWKRDRWREMSFRERQSDTNEWMIECDRIECVCRSEGVLRSGIVDEHPWNRFHLHAFSFELFCSENAIRAIEIHSGNDKIPWKCCLSRLFSSMKVSWSSTFV